MRAAKKPRAHVAAKPVVQWAVGQRVKYYKMHGVGIGWHYGRVAKVGRIYTTVDNHGTQVQLTHDQISTDV